MCQRMDADTSALVVGETKKQQTVIKSKLPQLSSSQFVFPSPIMAIVLGILQLFYGNKIPCEFIWKTIDTILIYILILMSMNMKI